MPTVPSAADVGITLIPDFSQVERKVRDFERRAVLNLKINGGQSLGKITGQISEFDKSLAAANARVIAFGASVGIITGISTAIKALVTEAIKLDDTLIQINSLFGKSASSLNKFRDELFDIARDTGQSFNVVAEAAKEFARQGLTAEETAKRTADALKLVRISGLDATKAVETITAGLNTFNELAGDSTAIVDKLTAVDARFAVSAKDLAEALSRVGNTAEEAGTSFDELLGIVTSVQQRTARGGAVIGNALKTIFTRTQQSDTIKQLQQLGVAVQDVEGNLLPALDILSQVSNKIDSLPDTQRNSIQKLLGGQYNINILKAQLADLADQNSITARAAETSANAQGDAARRTAELNKSLAAQANEAFANLQRIAGIAGKELFGPSLTKLFGQTDVFKDLFDERDGISGGEKFGLGILKGIGNVISGPGLALGALLVGKLLGKFTSFAGGAFKDLTGIGKPSEKVLALERGIGGVLAQNAVLQQEINSGLLTRVQIEQRIAAAIEQRIAAQKFESTLLRGAATNLSPRFGFNPDRGQFRNRASGNLPISSIPTSAILNEVNGAKKAGYSISPRDVRAMKAKIDGKQTTVVYNSKERVLNNFGGSGEPAIIPPGGIRNYAGGFDKSKVGQFIGNGVFRNVFNYGENQVFSVPKSLPSSLDVLKKAGQKITPLDIEQLEIAKAYERTVRPGMQKVLGMQGLGPKVDEILPSGAFIAEKIKLPTLRQLLKKGDIDERTSSNVLRRATESLKRIGFNNPDIHESNVAYNPATGQLKILDFAKGYNPLVHAANGRPFNFDQLKGDDLVRAAGQAGYNMNPQFLNANDAQKRILLRRFLGQPRTINQGAASNEALRRSELNNPSTTVGQRRGDFQSRRLPTQIGLARRREAQFSGLTPEIQNALRGREAANPSPSATLTQTQRSLEAINRIKALDLVARGAPLFDEGKTTTRRPNTTLPPRPNNPRLDRYNERRPQRGAPQEFLRTNDIGAQYGRPAGAFGPPRPPQQNPFSRAGSAISSGARSLFGNGFGYQSEKGQRFASSAGTAGFALSFLGPAIASSLGASEQTQRTVGGVTSGLGTAAILSSFGPAGAIVGGLLGSFQALKAVVDNLTPSVEDLQKEFNKSNERRQAGIQAGGQLSQVTAQLQNPNISEGNKARLSQQRLSLLFGRDQQGNRLFKQKDLDGILQAQDPINAIEELNSRRSQNVGLKGASSQAAIGAIEKLKKSTSFFSGISTEDVLSAGSSLGKGLSGGINFEGLNTGDRRGVLKNIGLLGRQDFSNNSVKETSQVIGETLEGAGVKDARENINKFRNELEKLLDLGNISKDEAVGALRESVSALFLELAETDAGVKKITVSQKQYAQTFEVLEQRLKRNIGTQKLLNTISNSSESAQRKLAGNRSLNSIALAGANERVGALGSFRSQFDRGDNTKTRQEILGIGNDRNNSILELLANRTAGEKDIRAQAISQAKALLDNSGGGTSLGNSKLLGNQKTIEAATSSIESVFQSLKNIQNEISGRAGDGNKQVINDSQIALANLINTYEQLQTSTKENIAQTNKEAKAKEIQVKVTDALNRALTGQSALLNRSSAGNILGGQGPNFGVIRQGVEAELSQSRQSNTRNFRDRLGGLNRRRGNDRTRGLIALGNERIGQSETIARGITEGFNSGALPNAEIINGLEARGSTRGANAARSIFERNKNRLSAANFDILQNNSRTSLSTQLSPIIGNLGRFVQGTGQTLAPGTQNKANLALQSLDFGAIEKLLTTLKNIPGVKSVGEIDRALTINSEAREDASFNRERAGVQATQTAGGLYRPLDVASYNKGIEELKTLLKPNPQSGAVGEIPKAKLEAKIDINFNGTQFQSLNFEGLYKLVAESFETQKANIMAEMQKFQGFSERILALEEDRPPLPVR